MAIIPRTGCLPIPFDTIDQADEHTVGPVVVPIPYVAPDVFYAGLRVRRRELLGSFSILFDGGGGRGDHAYVALDPLRILRGRDGVVALDGKETTTRPFDAIANLLGRHPIPAVPGPPPFQGGLAGYLGYELGGVLERLPMPKPAAGRGDDLVIGLFDTVVAFDCRMKKAWIIAHDLPGAPERARAETRVAGLTAIMGDLPKPPPVSWEAGSRARAEMSPKAFKEAVRKTIGHIRAGDIFQANITQRFLSEPVPGLDGWTLYRRLKCLTPAPYASYLDLDDGRFIASASPECFLKVSAMGEIIAKPIKGTRSRGENAEEDERLKASLRVSVKDRAENLMIVDLVRNDLSRVAALGTVRVPTIFDVQTFPAVHHLVSTVTATLRAGTTAANLLAASFPGGSVTGAPKIRAMEIIHALEPAPRGPYCGSIAWMGFSGTMDSAIVIRTLIGGPDGIVAQSGCGIVVDSDPDAEYRESMDKVRALIAAIAGRGSEQR